MTTTTTETAAEKSEVEITELASIEPTRMDGIGQPANGFPILMMKSLAPAPIEKAPAPTSAAAACGCAPDCACCSGTAKATAEPKAKKAKDGGKKTTKSATMPEGDSNTSTNAAITPDVIAKAVAEATGPLQAELKTLRDQMAKVLATPIPGGPQLVTPPTTPQQPNAALNEAARLRAIAKQTIDPETRASYLELAAREEGAPIT